MPHPTRPAVDGVIPTGKIVDPPWRAPALCEGDVIGFRGEIGLPTALAVPRVELRVGGVIATMSKLLV